VGGGVKLLLIDDDDTVGPKVEVDAEMVTLFTDSCRGNAEVFASTHVAIALAAAMPRPRIRPQSGDLLRRRCDGVSGVVYRDDDCLLCVGHLFGADAGLDPDEWDHIPAADIPWPERA